MSSERVEVSASSTADALAYDGYSSVELGFEITNMESRAEAKNNIDQFAEFVNEKRSIKQTSQHDNGSLKQYIFLEVQLSYIEQVLWRFVPKFMADRERDTIIGHYSQIGIEVRPLSLNELEKALLP